MIFPSAISKEVLDLLVILPPGLSLRGQACLAKIGSIGVGMFDCYAIYAVLQVLSSQKCSSP